LNFVRLKNLLAGHIQCNLFVDFLGFVFKLGSQCENLRLEGPAFALDLAPFTPGCLATKLSGGLLARFLRGSCSSGQHALGSDIEVSEFDAAISENEFTDLIGMTDAARLENVKAAVALAVVFQIAEQNPAIHQGGDADLGL